MVFGRGMAGLGEALECSWQPAFLQPRKEACTPAVMRVQRAAATAAADGLQQWHSMNRDFMASYLTHEDSFIPETPCTCGSANTPTPQK